MNGPGGLHYDRYSVEGHREWLVRIGPVGGAPILFLPPLLEEMNRTRALMVAVMRALAAEGFCSWLPDLPGTGESERRLETCGWQDWTSAAGAVADRARSPEGKLLIASLRGGALLDDMPATAHWRFAPVNGASLIRDLERSSLVGADGQAGYSLSEHLRAGMVHSTPAPVTSCRNVRLDSDPKGADVKLNGPALWRRSEPATSVELGRLIASDIEDWARTCAIC